MVCALTVSAQLEIPAPGVQSFLWPDHNLGDPSVWAQLEQVLVLISCQSVVGSKFVLSDWEVC